MSTLTPEVTWAQRSSDSDETRNYLYVFINVPDVPSSSADTKINPTSVSFKGTNIKGAKYSVTLDLYDEIDPENSKTSHSPRGVELVLRKKKLGLEYWPRLLKESKKAHFIKTDFDKWVDEDEQDEAADDDYAANFGGFGEDGGLGGIDFSKLGGGGLPGAAGGEEEEEEEEDDEDLPELEGDEKPGKKIEEVA
ncbi:HSP20-like chaperone [Talaromyces proteolyticus]|uniref:HSP20-like chaperone n=1 Tax=Talaromyces proteolyticus TaxID=1131652 RepID=A0AAD4KU57_9EURO|nr:HSP20-like chaperone [Talaromyces proteolyticus]KAH8696626.1 HSP20-like chaperone [Talaromyces proteolyticus]